MTSKLMILVLGVGVGSLSAQMHGHEKHEQSPMSMKGFYGSYPFSREASGTAWQPESSPHEGLHVMAGDWMLMMHGFFQGVYTHQGGRPEGRASPSAGDRGDEKWFGNSMWMTMAQHPLAGGTCGIRSMLSLDPATSGGARSASVVWVQSRSFLMR